MTEIGIAGLGVVGRAVEAGMEFNDHLVFGYDPKFMDARKFVNLIDKDIIFLCVPTPSSEDGSCDTSIVEETIEKLKKAKYKGIIVIKSTVPPGFTQTMIDKYPKLKICFVPEFLRERCAKTDFIVNHDLLIIGTEDLGVADKIREVHKDLPKQTRVVSPTTAELCKYFNNIYNATLITFANSFAEVCESVGASYQNVKNTIVNRDHINDVYLNSTPELKGYDGVCLPKDVRAIASLVKEKSLNVDFFQTLLDENAKYESTVLPGMRKNVQL